MYSIDRSIRIRRLSWTALVVVPFALAACGGDTAEARPAHSGTPSVTAQPPEGSAAGHMTPAGASSSTARVDRSKMTVTTAVTYENADDVFKAGHYPEAAAMFESYVASNPENAFGFYMLGLSTWKAGDFSRAEGAFDTAIKLDSTFVKSYFNSARVLLDMKRAPEALERIEKGLSLDSTSGDGLRLEARALAQSGNVDSAMATYRRLLVINDEDVWGLNNLGVLLLDSGDFQGALGPLARVVQLKPTAPLFQNNFGMALERSGYPVAAKHAYEAAVRDDSTFTKAVTNLQRLRGIVTDSTAVDDVNPQDLAEQFRQRVKTWKDSATTGKVGR